MAPAAANSDLEQPLVQAQGGDSNDANPRLRHAHHHASHASLGSQGVQQHFLLQQEHNAGVGDGGLRAAVFGFLDGLVSNLCLILGVYAAVASGETSIRTLLVTGCAGLMAGAMSMSTGEWISMKAQDEAEQKELSTERKHLIEHYDDEAEEFAEYLSKHGVTEEVANLVTRDIKQSHAPVDNMLDMHARFELGIDPDEAGGSAPLKAAMFSFCTFATGALIPLMPWLLVFFLERSASQYHLPGNSPLYLTLGLSAVSLFVAGAVLARFTGVNAYWSGFRQLMVATLAASACLGVGSLFGVAVN